MADLAQMLCAADRPVTEVVLTFQAGDGNRAPDPKPPLVVPHGTVSK